MAARERERLRQAELESDRLREELETLANHLTHERAQREREKELARAREGAANDRVRLAQTRIVALEVRTMPDIPPPGVTRSLPPNPPTRSRQDRASSVPPEPLGGSAKRRRSHPVDPVPPPFPQEAISNAMHKTPKPGTAPRALAAAQTPTQTPSPAPFIGLSPPTSPRRVKNQIGGATTTPRTHHRRDSSLGGDGDDGRTPSSAMATRKPRRGVAASLHDLTHWRRPGRTARVAGGGLYLMLCVGSLRQMPLPAGTVACYAFIFTLAASLFTRLFQRVRRNLGFGLGLGGMDAAAAESKSELTRRRREAHVRLMAAKFGGWVAASAAARAPVAAEAWIYTEAVVRWDSPPATLRACFLLWFTSIVARVWWLSWGYTVALLWCAAFVVPPVVSALGPAAGDAARRAVTWYAGQVAERSKAAARDRRVHMERHR